MKERGRNQFAKFKFIINFSVYLINFLPTGFRLFLFDHVRNIRGKKGIAIRYILLKTLAKSCGDNVAIFTSVYLLNIHNLKIGNNVSIHPFCYIECGNKGEIIIGDDVSIAHGVSIVATNHQYQDNNMPIKDQGLNEGKVEIGNDVWIGAKATILANKSIGTRCIIAANAVVTKDVGDNSLIAGIPAKKIKSIG